MSRGVGGGGRGVLEGRREGRMRRGYDGGGGVERGRMRRGVGVGDRCC